MWFSRILSSTLFLSATVFTIPLAFDIGGRTCGLAFSLALSSFYFAYSTLRLLTPDHSRVRHAVVWLFAAAQWIVIPSLLIWSLNKFSVDADGSGGWVQRTFGKPKKASLHDWLFGSDGILETATIGAWDQILRWSTPAFQLGEGFCSLLVIQALGQITRWLVNRERGDSWMIGLLIVSGSIISSSVYFLWRIVALFEISSFDAILIGVAITCAIFLCSWGIVSGKGNPVESSLLFAYITLCIYQIFTDYQPSPASAAPSSSSSPDPALPPLPPIIMASYTTLLHVLSSLPSTLHTTFSLMLGAIMTLTPSVIISLAYRVFVMYASARIIPAIRQSGARALSQAPSLDDEDDAGKLLGLLSWYSPSILIAVYTSLLMQHSSRNPSFLSAASPPTTEAMAWTTAPGGNLWRWINLAGTMLVYVIELRMGRDDDGGGVAGHWKAD